MWEDLELISRKLPAKDAPGITFRPSVMFVTVCTKNRGRFLARDEVHRALRAAWSDGSHWVVGRYVIMPDHLHLFACERNDRSCSVDQWSRWWKRRVCLLLECAENSFWQKGIWDTRIYSGDLYRGKIYYVVNNPVRAGLVTNSDAWAYQGEINRLPWVD
jgi:putative transposase